MEKEKELTAAEVITDKDVAKQIVKARGETHGMVQCDEFGIPFDYNYAANTKEYHATVGFGAIPKEAGGAMPNLDRGIVIDCSKKMTEDEIRENIMLMNQAVAKPSDEPKEKEVTLKDQSFMFMMAKDKNKIDLKQYLNKMFNPDEKEIKDEFIKSLYATKILYKSFKHINFASKRLILNNRLRAKVLEYSSDTEIAANDILSLLSNDSGNYEYLSTDLPFAVRKMIDRGIKL